MDFIGEFETHITVASGNLKEVEKLQNWCQHRHLKFLHILLDRGATLSQPMVTRHGKGNFNNELEIAFSLTRDLNRDGFSVNRIKIEAAPENEGIPLSSLEALQHQTCCYFEHHVKLILETDADLAPLLEIAQKCGAHLSRNALNVRDEGRLERFITQRCQAVGLIEAKQQLEKLLNAIATLEYQAIAVTQEFVVYDSNLALDVGWIQA